jgi:quinohemoprotein ethanol dehydrogenase
MNLGMAIGPSTFDASPKAIGDGTAALLAWDPVGQRKRWEVPLGDSFWNGGTLATAGNLVFQGTGSGKFNAYNATSGEHLWSFYAGLGVNAAPITYAINNVQYVAILVGYGGGINAARVHDYGWRYGEQPRRLLAFALGKSRPLPPGKPPRFTVNAIDNPSLVIDAKLAAEGEKLYRTFACDFCHGTNMRNIASFARDLRESALAATPEGFKAVVQDGALVALGMPKFEDLNEQNMRALYVYVRQQAREAVHQASAHDEIKH